MTEEIAGEITELNDGKAQHLHNDEFLWIAKGGKLIIKYFSTVFLEISMKIFLPRFNCIFHETPEYFNCFH